MPYLPVGEANEETNTFYTKEGESALWARGATPFGLTSAVRLLLFNCVVVSDSCDPMDCSPLGSSVHGISQVRILEWVAISFSNLGMDPCLLNWQVMTALCSILAWKIPQTEPGGLYSS